MAENERYFLFQLEPFIHNLNKRENKNEEEDKLRSASTR